MINLKIKKSLILSILSLEVFTLVNSNKINTVYAKDDDNIISVNNAKKDEKLLFEVYKRTKKYENFKTTNTYYLVDVNKSRLPYSTAYKFYSFKGTFNKKSFDNIIFNSIATSSEDCENSKFINISSINKEGFKDYHLEKYNDTVNKVVNPDGVVLGYTPKTKILIYNENYVGN